jgi:hypothetical protein
MELDQQKVKSNEERVLCGVVEGFQTHFQVQLQNFPSLGQLQQRTRSTTVQEGGISAKAMKPMDDAEIRRRRKAILLLKVRKGLSRSGLVGPRFH